MPRTGFLSQINAAVNLVLRCAQTVHRTCDRGADCTMRFCFSGGRIEAGIAVSIVPGGAGPHPTDCVVEFGDSVTVRGHYHFLADRSILLDIPRREAETSSPTTVSRWQLKLGSSDKWIVAGSA